MPGALKHAFHAFVGGLALCAATAAVSQQYPSKPVRLIVGFAPGGGIDVFSRSLAPGLSAALGQPVIVENRPASAGLVGAESVAKSTPDGYTLLMSGSWMVVGSLMYRKLAYDADRDFTPIGLVADSIVHLYVHPSVPVKSLQELLAYAKANPGKLNFASAGVGHPFHLAMELFKQKTGIDMVHVPYKGMNPAITDVIAGRVQAVFYTASGQLMELVKAGKMMALVSVADKRHPNLRDTPTMKELGLPDFRPAANLALAGPAGLPRAIVDRLNRELISAASTPEAAAAYQKISFEKVTSTPEEYARVVKEEIATWGPLIRNLNIALD